MCGITGIINFNGKQIEEKDLRTMMHKIKHRGPDDEGTFIENNIGFGFVRLSILDLSKAGHQPMFSHNNRFVIVFNGEVYNYIELRNELKYKFNFITGTDTEVILAAYQEWGDECLKKFNGMFAFVIYDRTTGNVFAARDRYGIKPFYYLHDNNKFIFASEIKSILPLLKEKKPNNGVIYDYLLYNRTDHTDETFFKDIYKLQHGHYLKIESREVRFYNWYNLKENLSFGITSPKEYREFFKDSLKLRLRADVPIGICLSGGLDSSSIASSLLKDFNLKELNTFSAIYDKNEPSNESEYIDAFNSYIKNMYYITPTADTFYNDLDSFIDAHNEPVPDIGPYAQFKVMQLAKDHVTVTLDGQGADEQLGGYHNFFGSYYIELLRKLKFIKLFSENYHYIKNHHSFKSLKYFSFYLVPTAYKDLISHKRFPSVSYDFVSENGKNSIVSSLLYEPKSLQDALLQHFEYKLEHLLHWEDLNAMHFSIESRVPFLDYRLVENTISLEPGKIINKGTTKYILREAMKDVLPNSIYFRKDKKNFSNPRDKWFRTYKFNQLIFLILNSPEFNGRGYFDSKVATERYKLHLNAKADISQEIWKWINLEMWFRKFIDG